MNKTEQAMDVLLHGTSRPTHSPILETPEDHGMEYEEVTVVASDGLELSAWYIPTDSNKLIISNHFSPGNKYGYAGHLKEYENPAGEVNAIPRYKALHDAGFNVLTYDCRGHGSSPDPKDGVIGLGLKEWLDVIGSIEFAFNDKRTEGMDVSMMNICMGANSAMIAMRNRPEMFENIKSQMLLQPFNMRSMVEKSFSLMGADTSRLPEFEERYASQSGFRLDDHDMRRYANAVSMPTMLVQVRDDVSIDVSYIDDIYESIPIKDKKMFWIEGTPHRFDAYKYFSEYPEVMVEWFESHMM
ncbi:alpha/beta hydrolase [Planctomycetota bacterium]|nr:alpha/beta hydrolase [Planctomycetota bacterium]